MNTASPPPRLPRYPLLPVHSREHHRPCLLSFLQTLRLSFSKPSRPHHPFYQSCTGGWVNFFSNFLLLFPVDLTFHAPGQVTHKPLPLSHQAAKIFFFLCRGDTCRRPWGGEAGWEEGPGTASSQAGFLQPTPHFSPMQSPLPHHSLTLSRGAQLGWVSPLRWHWWIMPP